MSKFVAVRVVQANAMDLRLFQFDYDMSFAVTFLHPDRTVYGRFGTRNGNEEAADDEISMAGLAAAMSGALELHAGYPGNKASLVGKQPVPSVKYPTPEKIPTMGKYKSVLDYDGKIAGSCIHCHSIRDKQRRIVRDAGEILGLRELSPWPMPLVLGIQMDAQARATVANVVLNSPAASAGLKAGDQILKANGQPILSTADLQWTLHAMDDNAKLVLDLTRSSEPITLTVTPQNQWRESSDIAWRVSTWDLRRIALGGMRLERIPTEARTGNIPKAGKMALRALNVGQYGDHATAKKAGLKKEDVIVEFNGDSGDLTESELIKRIVSTLKKGEKVSVDYLRSGERRETSFQLQ
ncbi:MAG: PDZ domain-containing protein [Verrucomicrobiae bacterium]|nr:PDZ domain-containing protein [Verrucomicrobiae bacterium]